MIDTSTQRRIYIVSELTAEIKALLEENFPFIWITGEISNFRVPLSGHFYFTLKDENAQINAVMFRAQNRKLVFYPEDGTSVTGLGRISVYEPRGNYQLILEYLEPAGAGAIQVAFEQLKLRLADEGLFDEKYKKPLPFLPKKISIITSPSGAVVHDILKILNRRFINLNIEIVPSKVQGDGAEKEIVSALELLNDRFDTDVVILARGGGSMEDMHAFNSEDVARAIFASNIPVISAVGHETDFSIADFVADLRAPTPSAAAEMAVPVKHELKNRCSELTRFLTVRYFRYIDNLQTVIKGLSQRLIDPQKKIDDLRLRIDDLTSRLVRICVNNLAQRRERLMWRTESLYKNSPLMQSKIAYDKLEQININLLIYIKIYLDKKQYSLRELSARLHSLSPAAILDRGYSITSTHPEGVVVRDPHAVAIGQDLEVMVAKGSLFCRVKGK
ncbi:MAG: exodeoxyribonuclease VII large subunit [Desulfobacteraceae bacterium]|nr:exodeoxyribonuclease VII large subunit [Desulfobacteraceae bacterium]